MKSKHYLLIVFSFFLLQFNAQTNYNQYFDGADTSITNSIMIEIDSTDTLWQIGAPQKTFFTGASTFPNVIVTDTLIPYPNNDTSSFIAKYVPDYNVGIFAINWVQKLDYEAGKDGGKIEYSTDNGLTWENTFNNPYVYNFFGFDYANCDTLGTNDYVLSGTDTNWRDIWLCFESSWLNVTTDTVLFKFTSISDSSQTNQDGWMIDNMLSHITWTHTLAEMKQEEYVLAYPNPSNDLVHVHLQKQKSFHIIEKMDLINAKGETVDSWGNIPTKFFIDVKKYPAGNYQLRIQSNIKTEAVSIVIE